MINNVRQRRSALYRIHLLKSGESLKKYGNNEAMP